MCKKYVLVVFLLFVSMGSLPFSGAAALLSPGLQAVLSSATSDAEIPVIVTLAATEKPAALAQRLGRAQRGQFVYEMKSRSHQNLIPLRELLSGYGIDNLRPLWLINAVAFSAPPAVIDEIANMAGVESISFDDMLQLPQLQAGEMGVPEWNIERIGAPELWFRGYDGTGVTVAILDSGVNIDHPDLQGKWRGLPGDWFDPYGNTQTPYDFGDFHGTGVAGVVVGGNSGGSAIGVAPGSNFIAAKLFRDDGTANNSFIIAGLQWALNPGGDPDNAPAIINNSWGFDSQSGCLEIIGSALDLRGAVQVLRSSGVAVVTAAGNAGPSFSTSTSPANFPENLAVGATTDAADNRIASFSSRGPSACPEDDSFPDLVAPGVNIRVVGQGATYSQLSGTSFSTPHLAGAMALLIQAVGTLPVPELEGLLTSSATDLGDPGVDDIYGYGLLNVAAALRLIEDSPALVLIGTSATTDPSEEMLNFGTPVVDQSHLRTVALRNTGGGTLNLNIDDSEVGPPFSVTANSCSGAALGTGEECSISVAFSPQASGSFSAAIRIASNDSIRELVTVRLVGSGAEVVFPHLVIVPETLDFGQVEPDHFETRSLSLENTGDAALTDLVVVTSALTAPFSLIENQCSSQLAPGQFCFVSFHFAPVEAGDYAAEVAVTSSDPERSGISVPLTGVGNTPPTRPVLVSPTDGAVLSGANGIRLSWFPATDDDGDAVVQTLLLADNPEFSNPRTFNALTVSTVLSGGLLLLLTAGGRRRGAVALIALVSLLWLGSCGGGGGGGGGDDSGQDENTTSIRVDGLMAGQYFWKVVAEDDRGAIRESDVRSFTVE